MNIEPTDTKQDTITDDQELAKVLAGVTDDPAATEEPAVPQVVPMTPPPTAMPMPPSDDASLSADDTTATSADDSAQLVEPPSIEVPAVPVAPVAGSDDLASIKQEAIGELRPLVDKLEVSPEEKFDTYLLLIRSTDDRALVGPAHVAAQAITDETRRAQALLDIIKEIDFLSQNN